MGANLGYLFYNKMYRKKVDGNNVTLVLDNNVINNILDTSNSMSSRLEVNKFFIVKTLYPGLLTGVGFNHGLKNENDDFKIGFYFDHTTGMPTIPGSSVKGVLRSVFPLKTTNEEIKEVRYRWIQELLKNIMDAEFPSKLYQPGNNVTKLEKDNIDNIEREIFEGKKNDTFVSIYESDIFHDAIIEGNKKFLDTDYITPHFKNVLKEPEPLKMIKVTSDVTFRFQFDLKNGIISADDKLKLFQKIITTIGIGAKTNIGYGQFK